METKKKILLVDDDPDIISVVETILENEGYEVISAFNKNEGLQKARDLKPDLAIVDVMMSTPHEGFELAGELTREKGANRLPVMMQTSIEVFEANNDDVMKFARYYRENMGGKEMDVLLVQDYESKKAGVDYVDTNGNPHWLSVDGFIRKPVNAARLISSIRRVLEPEADRAVI